MADLGQRGLVRQDAATFTEVGHPSVRLLGVGVGCAALRLGPDRGWSRRRRRAGWGGDFWRLGMSDVERSLVGQDGAGVTEIDFPKRWCPGR